MGPTQWVLETKLSVCEADPSTQSRSTADVYNVFYRPLSQAQRQLYPFTSVYFLLTVFSKHPSVKVKSVMLSQAEVWGKGKYSSTHS
jgi:hypothetical protein